MIKTAVPMVRPREVGAADTAKGDRLRTCATCSGYRIRARKMSPRSSREDGRISKRPRVRERLKDECPHTRPETLCRVDVSDIPCSPAAGTTRRPARKSPMPKPSTRRWSAREQQTATQPMVIDTESRISLRGTEENPSHGAAFVEEGSARDGSVDHAEPVPWVQIAVALTRVGRAVIASAERHVAAAAGAWSRQLRSPVQVMIAGLGVPRPSVIRTIWRRPWSARNSQALREVWNPDRLMSKSRWSGGRLNGRPDVTPADTLTHGSPGKQRGAKV